MLRSDRNETVLKARALRRAMTLPEGLLWQQLRRRPCGLKFRRQHPIGPFIADFYCAAAKLIIEVDGSGHDMGDSPGRDARRDDWLVTQGFAVLRFAATEVMRNMEAVVSEVAHVSVERLPLHHALHGSPPHDVVVGRN